MTDPLQYKPATKLVSMTVSGNLHDVARCINTFGWADFFVQAEYSGGYNSTVLLRLPVDWPTDEHGPLTVSQIKQRALEGKAP